MLNKRPKNATDSLRNCQITSTSLDAKKQLYSTNRDAYKLKLVRELELITDIWFIYSNGLSGVSEGLKQRIDDGLQNGHF